MKISMKKLLKILLRHGLVYVDPKHDKGTAVNSPQVLTAFVSELFQLGFLTEPTLIRHLNEHVNLATYGADVIAAKIEAALK